MSEGDAPAASDPLRRFEDDARAVDLRLREGRFQRALALVAGLSSLVSGLEVGYEHYKGSYSRRVMYTPVILSGGLAVAGVAAYFSPRAARTALPALSVLMLADCAVGFYFHVRGIGRKPGGWRLPIVNMVMGPPIFAPLLFGVSAYLGLIASQLRRGDDTRDHAGGMPHPASPTHWARRMTGGHEAITWEQDVREGRFQKQMIVATVTSVFLSGFESWYSHYKNNFRYPVQWSPVLITPLLMATGIAALFRVRIAHTALPAVSALAVLDGAVGFGFHVRGTLRRSGGRKKLAYNIIYGPPIFAPLLFAASGSLGVLASLLRRESER